MMDFKESWLSLLVKELLKLDNLMVLMIVMVHMMVMVLMNLMRLKMIMCQKILIV